MKFTYKLRLYCYGVVAAGINAASNAGVVMFVDWSDFNPFHYDSLKKLGIVMGSAALLGILTYIKQHPLPDLEKDIDYYEVRSKQLDAIRKTGEPHGPENCGKH